MLSGVRAGPAGGALVARTRRSGTPHPATRRRLGNTYPAPLLPTPPTSPNNQGSSGNQMPPPARPHLMETRLRRFSPDAHGTAKQQRTRRAANRENVNNFGGENGRRLLVQLVSTSFCYL